MSSVFADASAMRAGPTPVPASLCVVTAGRDSWAGCTVLTRKQSTVAPGSGILGAVR